MDTNYALGTPDRKYNHAGSYMAIIPVADECPLHHPSLLGRRFVPITDFSGPLLQLGQLVDAVLKPGDQLLKSVHVHLDKIRVSRLRSLLTGFDEWFTVSE